MPWRGMCVSIAGDWGSSNPALTISRGPCGALGLACSPEPPLHRHALVPIGFRRKVRRLTQKHLSQLLLPAAGIRPAVFHGARFPAPGSCRRSNVTGIRGLGGPSSSGPWVRPSGTCRFRLCVRGMRWPRPSFDRPPSLHTLRHRLSAGVVRGFIGTMQPSDSSAFPDSVAPRLPVAARDRRGDCGRHEVSQVPTRSLTARTGLRPRQSDGPSHNGPAHVACGGSHASASTS